jgi:hypothetical protein
MFCWRPTASMTTPVKAKYRVTHLLFRCVGKLNWVFVVATAVPSHCRRKVPVRRKVHDRSAWNVARVRKVVELARVAISLDNVVLRATVL